MVMVGIIGPFGPKGPELQGQPVLMLACSIVTAKMLWVPIQGASPCVDWTGVALERDSVVKSVSSNLARLSLKGRV